MTLKSGDDELDSDETIDEYVVDCDARSSDEDSEVDSSDGDMYDRYETTSHSYYSVSSQMNSKN